MLPPTPRLARNTTHRLIPTRYSEDPDGVLARLGLPQSLSDNLRELDGATSDRLHGEANLLPGITVHELVFGVPYDHIVNAAFCYARPGGARFSSSYRGAWYASFGRRTAQMEVAYHYARALQEIDWREEETVSYRDYMADFRADFHDLRQAPRFADCLDPDRYKASQRLAADLLHRGSAGVIYPSVRHQGGTCVACFRPALVANVRQGEKITFTFADPSRPPTVRSNH